MTNPTSGLIGGGGLFVLLSINDEYRADFFSLWPRNVSRTGCLSGGCGAHGNKGTCGNTAAMGISIELQANGFTS